MQQRHMTVFKISLIAALGGFLFGFDTAVISGTLAMVKEQFQLSNLAEGWFVSSALVGCIAGVGVAGWLADRFGRKPMLLFSALLFFLSALGCALAPDQQMLIAARWLGGVGVGIASMLSPMFITELAPSDRRGQLVSLYQFAITLGILSAYFANAWVAGLSWNVAEALPWMKKLFTTDLWRGMFANELLPAGLFGVLLLFIPESPRWLISKGRQADAGVILRRFLPEDEADAVIREAGQTAEATGVSLKQLWRPGLRKALLIGILLPVFSQFSGINAVIYYGPTILKEAGFTFSDALGGQVSIGVINVLFTVLAILFIDRAGRKPLLVVGTSGAVLALTAIGLLFARGQTSGFWVLAGILVFIACFAFSLGPIPWIVISEIFPTGIRGRAVSIGTLALWGSNALVGLLFPFLMNMKILNGGGPFFLFAGSSLAAVLFIVLIIPETKGLSLELIQKHFNTQEARP